MKRVAVLGMMALTVAVNFAPMKVDAAGLNSCPKNYQTNRIVSTKNCNLSELTNNLQNLQINGNCIKLGSLDQLKDCLTKSAATNTTAQTPSAQAASTQKTTEQETAAQETTAQETTVQETTTQDKSTSLSYAEQVVKLVNEERAKEGLAALSIDKNVEKAALIRAKEIQSSFSHTRPNGSSFSTALQESGVSYRGAGENIAWGQKTPEQVVEGWMNSPGHRANIMNEKFTKIGVGNLQNSTGTQYWVQLFTY